MLEVVEHVVWDKAVSAESGSTVMPERKAADFAL
jgi:hypothetical protein